MRRSRRGHTGERPSSREEVRLPRCTTPSGWSRQVADLRLPHDRASRLIAELESRVRELDAQRRGPHLGFVSSDLPLAYSALRDISDRGLARGPVFCDWGSGYGSVPALASLLDFEAYGIEIQAELVSAAEALAEDLGLDVTYAHGTFVPPGHEQLSAQADNSWWGRSETSGYEVLDLAPEEIDIFYAYPWPGEEPLIETLFLRCASEGALLLTYREGGTLRLLRK